VKPGPKGMPAMMEQRVVETRVGCAHCGGVVSGYSQALVWAEAMACASSHQEKSYRYAPELKPAEAAALVPRTGEAMRK
jgi:hypothetical protein